MCGIFGLVIENNKFFEDEFIKTVVDQLYIFRNQRQGSGWHISR